MQRLALLVLVAVCAARAEAATMFYRDFSSFVPVNQNVILPGEDLAFRITADSGPTLEWLWDIPAYPGDCCMTRSYTFTEANASEAGLDWAALESAMNGDRGQGTQFGPVGYELTTPYLVDSSSYLSNVNLSEVRITLNQFSKTRWSMAAITLDGTFTGLAPEPSSFVLLLGMVHAMACSRKRAATNRRS